MECEPFVRGTFEVVSNADEGRFVGPIWRKCVTCTLVDCKGNVRADLAIKVEQHANYHTGIVDHSAGRVAVVILRKWGLFGWGWAGLRVFVVRPRAAMIFLVRPGLCHGDGVVCIGEVDANITFGDAFMSESNIFGLHLTDECVDDVVGGGRIDQKVVDEDNDEEIVTKEETRIRL